MVSPRDDPAASKTLVRAVGHGVQVGKADTGPQILQALVSYGNKRCTKVAGSQRVDLAPVRAWLTAQAG